MGPYRYEACHVDTDVAYTNNGYSGAFRGFGNTEVCAGHRAGRGRVGRTARHRPDRLPPAELPAPRRSDSPTASAWAMTLRWPSAWSRCAATVRLGPQARGMTGTPGAAGGGRARRRSTPPLARHRRGRRVSRHLAGSGGRRFCRQATLAVNDDYSLTLTSGLTDYGTGSRTVYTLIAAETLGLQPDRIRHAAPRYRHRLDSGPTVASRATVLGRQRRAGRRHAPGQPAARGRRRSAGLPRSPGAARGRALHRPERGTGYLSRMWWTMPGEIGLTLSATRPLESRRITTGRLKPARASPTLPTIIGAQVAEVLVDTGTGKVEVTGIWAAHNTGKVIFPQGALGQLYGGITQGLGYALMERVDYDDGYIQATNFDEYLIPDRPGCARHTGAIRRGALQAGSLRRQEHRRTGHGADRAGNPQRHFPRHRPSRPRPAGRTWSEFCLAMTCARPARPGPANWA